MKKYLGLFVKFIKNPFVICRAKCWGIGLIDDYSGADIIKLKEREREISDIIWIEGKRAGDFYADPFITDYFGDKIVFFENYIDKEDRGIISYVTVKDIKEHSNDIQKYIHNVLDFETHLSYPYLFVYNDDLYMVPENYQSHTISLYKVGSTPSDWNKVSVMIPDFDGIDTTIFEHNDLWYMFSTRNISGTKSEHSELHIWYSDNPLGGWKKHRLSPIIYDEPIARGAGHPFVVDGVLYRPAQDCSRAYGGELLIKKITELTPDSFSEEVVTKLSGIQPFENAFHTFCSSGDVSVIDGIKIKFSFIHGFYYLKRVMRDILK